MNGKYFGSAGINIHNDLDLISKDECVLKDFLKLAKLFDVLGDVLYLIIHDLDCIITGHSLIKNEKDKKEFQEKAIKKIKEVINANI